MNFIIRLIDWIRRRKCKCLDTICRRKIENGVYPALFPVYVFCKRCGRYGELGNGIGRMK